MVNLSEYYEVLGLRPGATQEEIRRAYADLAQVWHPNRFPNDPRLRQKAEEKLNIINDAYAHLKVIGDRTYATSGQAESPISRQSQTQASASASPSKTPKKLHIGTGTIWIVAGIAIAILYTIFGKSGTPPGPTPGQIEYKQPTIPPQKPITDVYKKKDSYTSSPGPSLQKNDTGSKKPVSSSNLEIKISPFPANSIPAQPFKEVRLAPANKKEGYITVGSTAEEVLAIQGKPDKKLGLGWFYGNSTITISEGKVISYVNKGNLKTKNEPTKSPTSTSLSKSTPVYFTIGSTKDEVIAVQGKPDSIFEASFRYGNCYVYFSGDRVEGWDSWDSELKVMLSSLSSPRNDYFTLGSTKDEVIAIQGTPDGFSENDFRYDTSHVRFEGGRVVGWDIWNPELEVVLRSFSSPLVSYFTIGSTKDEVIAVQGRPDGFSENDFRYGTSHVRFKGGRVVGWDDLSSELRVRK